MGKSDIPDMLGDITFGSTPPKVVSRTYWVVAFPIHFFWMYGGIGITRGFWGMSLRIDPSESDIPQHSGSRFLCTPPHQYRW
jgi:hypothetical protein